MSFQDAVKKLIKDAPAVQSGGNFVNYGPLKTEPMVITFHGKGNKPTKRTLQEYMEENGLEDGDEIELSDQDSFQLHIEIGVDEVNPALTFQYQRDIPILTSNGSVKTDWEATVLPSLIKVFGNNWDAKLFPNGSKKAKTFYVAAENVPSLRKPRDNEDGTPGKNHGVPKFIEMFESLEECKEARDKRYPPHDDAAAMDYGEPVEGEEDEEDEFTENQLEQALTLYASTKKNRKQTIAMLKKMFKDVDDPAALLDAALESEE